ncbi:YaeQ family protein [Armatimonas rosea]|uniref:Uncharacterized protein YaeQ n=1 Tax=Armatimonas rosea TaxID=685828 RepID=A0A7W9SVR2_ARMRO|nr:uncharacterized protein YaeQ [Armatimonas rosea]
MKYSFTLLEDGEREKLILESGGDLPRHVVLKLLAYLLYRKQHALEIEKGVGQRHKPDLVAQNPVTGQVQLWIDCGQIETDRLGRIVAKNRHAEVVVVKATAREAERYAAVAARDVTGHATVLGFDDGFTERFVELLRGTNTVEVVCLEETIRIVLNGEALESARQACSCRA